MAQRRDIARDELSDAIADGPGLGAARAISIIFSPPFVAIATCLLVAYAQPQPFAVGVEWVLIMLALQMLPGLALYLYRRRTGAYRDADVSVRQDRNELYLIGSVSVLISIVVLRLMGAPAGFLALAVGTLMLGVVCGLVNLYWKISMHAATIGSLATIGTLYAPGLGAALWCCALAVGWARVRTRNHTPLQVLAGLVASAVVVATAFTLLAPR